jgi:soluble lytic murein transglycosylase-like protein
VPIPPQAPTPTPAPESTGTTYSGGDIESIITAAAQAAGVAPSWLISTAECESGLNPNAYNGSGPYEGLFQFLPSTFSGHGGTDIWDPTQQAQIAATMFASGESGEWPVCSR